MSEQALKRIPTTFRTVEELFGQIIEINNKTTKDMDIAANNMGKTVKTWIVITMVIGLLAAIFTAIGIAKSIVTQCLHVWKQQKNCLWRHGYWIWYNRKWWTWMLQKAMAKMVTAIQRVIEDATKLSQAAVEGKLATRADATKHQGDFRRIIEGVNSTPTQLSVLSTFLRNMLTASAREISRQR